MFQVIEAIFIERLLHETPSEFATSGTSVNYSKESSEIDSEKSQRKVTLLKID